MLKMTWCSFLKVRWLLFHFLLYLIIVAATAVDAKTNDDFPCGKQQILRKGRVIGGENSYPGEFPWTVSIKFSDSMRHHCGGTILDDEWILTAAHCLSNYRASDFRVRLGAIGTSGREAIEVGIKSIIIHEDFNFPRPMSNDIALLRLDRSMNFTQYIIPVCLPTSSESSQEINPHSRSRATVVGWGWTTYDKNKFPAGQSPEILQKVDVEVIEKDMCSMWFLSRGRRVTLDSKQFCAGYEKGGKDSCRGDSGGPLILKENSTNTYYIIGIVSAGIECAEPSMPGVYTRVSAYLDWIQDKIERPFIDEVPMNEDNPYLIFQALGPNYRPFRRRSFLP
ncbi:brain-specific serine protease 4-like [Brevipalpus obovatus]|uniref:brain-specific serine protease 4-like n=1 Tax=Brevipalpus obovatus TaxID=246614 RepID=UPI003D9E11BF